MTSPFVRRTFVVAGTVLSFLSIMQSRHVQWDALHGLERWNAAHDPARDAARLGELVRDPIVSVPDLASAGISWESPERLEPLESLVPSPSAPVVLATLRPAGLAQPAVAFALAQVGKPYRFDAAGPEAFDCSGLTRAAYLTVGIELPHYASYQATWGVLVDWQRSAIRPGDLIFVRGGRPRHDLGHVGIALSASEWVVAPAPGQRVRQERIPLGSIQAVRRIVPA